MGAYVIQAAIASLQTWERIDWPQVGELYRRLVDLTGSTPEQRFLTRRLERL